MGGGDPIERELSQLSADQAIEDELVALKANLSGKQEDSAAETTSSET
jgi:hypothetical protein